MKIALRAPDTCPTAVTAAALVFAAGLVAPASAGAQGLGASREWGLSSDRAARMSLDVSPSRARGNGGLFLNSRLSESPLARAQEYRLLASGRDLAADNLLNQRAERAAGTWHLLEAGPVLESRRRADGSATLRLRLGEDARETSEWLGGVRFWGSSDLDPGWLRPRLSSSLSGGAGVRHVPRAFGASQWLDTP